MNGPVEPRADLRQAAQELRQWYVALRHEGFSEAETLQIIGHTIAAARGA